MKKKQLETPISCEEQLKDLAKAGRPMVGIHMIIMNSITIIQQLENLNTYNFFIHLASQI